jgi:tetratricopeptide (TPR) repeat protein
MNVEKRGDGGETRNLVSGSVRGPVVQGRDFHGDMHFHMHPAKSVSAVPWQVPLRVESFVNREAQIESLDRLAAQKGAQGAPSIGVVRGSRGVGKSAIGRHWAHVNRDRFPDGQLYVDFREYRHTGESAVGTVLGELLRSLGLPDDSIPIGTGERAKRFRTETADKRLLLLLDDVERASEVTQLLPTSSDSFVLVTTNEKLRELFRIGGRPVELGPLNRQSAGEMLAEMIGDVEEEAAVEELVTLCAGLPVALSVCGARLLGSGRSVSWLVELLSDEAARLAEIDYEEGRSLQAVFDEGYAALSEPARLLYRRLGLFPGTTVSPILAAVASGTGVPGAERLLDEVSGACLIEEVGDRRFAYHDLLRLHARGRAAQEDSEEERDTAVQRMVDFYVSSAQRMDRAIALDRLRLSEEPPPPLRGEAPLRTGADALAWFEVERSNLLAVLREAFDRESNEAVWMIGEALWLAYHSHRHWSEAAEVYGLASKAAHRAGDSDAEARMRSQLARAEMELGDLDVAMEELETCAELMQGSPNLALVSSIVEWTGVLHLKRGEEATAIDAFEQALRGFEEAGVPRGVAMQRYLLGRTLLRTGELGRAARELRQAAEGIDPETDQFLHGRVLWRLGAALAGSGEMEAARAVLGDAATTLQRYGAPLYEARAREEIAALERRAGDAAAEARELEGALAIYAEFGEARAEPVMARLAELRG